MPYRPKIKNNDGSLTDLPLEAETAVKLKTSRSIGLSGVTATAQSFNGTSAITIPITSIPGSLLTGNANINITGSAATALVATTATNANNVVKDSNGLYHQLTLDSNNKMLLDSSTRVVLSKTPLLVQTIGTASEDYTILSGTTFPTPNKYYEIVYEDSGCLKRFYLKFPSSTTTIYFSLLFGVCKSSYDYTIKETGTNNTYKTIRWKIDTSGKTVKHTKVSGGSCAATTVYFKGIYELHEEIGK